MSDLSVLHLLWKLPAMQARGILGAVACPPKLLESVTPELMNHSILRIVQDSVFGTAWSNLAEVKTGLIDQITVSNLVQSSAVVMQLYKTFLTRLSFPRLVHFLDLVLPQMLPHQRIRDHDQVRHLTSHYLSLLAQEGNGYSPWLDMNFLFHSHAGLVHVMIEWHKHPLLVFSHYPKVLAAM